MRSRFHVAVMALSVAFVACRTPPPLPQRSPEPHAAPAPASTPRAARVPAPPPAHEPAEPAVPAPVDYVEELRQLAQRYGQRRALATLRGEASYYGRAFAGRKTASGEVFEPARFTAAHRTLPFGTVLRVTRLETKAVVYVRVNDRGPFGKKRRIIDLSEAAARELDMLRDGICDVRVEVLERGKKPGKKPRKKRGKKR